MKPWKAILGLGAACAACCALPLAGGLAALLTTSTALAVTGSALLACASELIRPASILAGLGLLGLALWAWRRNAVKRQAACSCCAGGGACALPGN
jgi:hypothetical protein